MSRSEVARMEIRNVPDQLHADLKVWAAQERTSLTALLIDILSRAVEERKGAAK